MDSLLRFNIANQYNLFHYQMINLSLINKISEEQKIPLKELMNLLDISYSSRKKFENQIDTNAYIKIYSIEELKEIEREIVQEVLKFPQMNEERMLFLEQKYRITRSILKKILKISNNTYYRKIRNGKIVELKFENKKTAIKLDKTLKTKEKIKKIQLDLKYLKNYGRRFYSKQELDLMSYTYKIDVHELLLYLAHKIGFYMKFMKTHMKIIHKVCG